MNIPAIALKVFQTLKLRRGFYIIIEKQYLFLITLLLTSHRPCFIVRCIKAWPNINNRAERLVVTAKGGNNRPRL